MDRSDTEFHQGVVRAAMTVAAETLNEIAEQNRRIVALEDTVSTISKLLELLPADIWSHQ